MWSGRLVSPSITVTLGFLLQKLADEAGDDELPEVDRRKEQQLPAQRGVILAQAAIGLLGLREDRARIGQQAAARLRHAHAVRIAPQQRGTAALLQRPQLAAQARLGDPQPARAGGNAPALHDGDEGPQ
jgi:hypothetical protein